MRIFLFIRSLAVGGSQRQLVMLAAGLAQRSHDVRIVVLYGGTPMEALLSGSGVKIVTLDKSGRWDLLGPLMKWRNVVREFQPEIIYSFQPTQTAVSALLVWNRDIRLVFGLRASDMRTERYGWLSKLVFQLEAVLSGRADLIISNSLAGSQDARSRGMQPRKLAVVPNGIDTNSVRFDERARRAFRQQWAIPEGAFVIGMVARLDPMKDHKTFLRAAHAQLNSFPETRFVCIGGGPERYRQELASCAKEIGLADRVIWAGELPDATTAYSAFDMATLSSAFGEGFPNAVGEAMACERPVAATDVGDVALVVGECGEVVPPGRPDLLCAGWTRLRKRIDGEPDLGRNARQHIQTHFSVDAMVGSTERLLAVLVSKDGHVD